MFVIPTSVGFGHRAVATLVAIALVLMSIGFYTTAQAANLVDVSNTLTDSDIDAISGHTIQFNVPASSTIGTGDTITISFPPEFGGTAASQVADVTSGDVTVTVNGTPATPGSFSALGQDISFDNISAAGNATVTIAIDPVVDNPDSFGSYEFTINTGNGDIGKTRVAILDNVVVTAIVETTFDFTVSGLATSTSFNGTTTTGSSTADEIPFFVLDAGVSELIAQRLNVTTNANSGFVVTVETDGDLQSANGAIIDTFSNGTDVSTPTLWSSPSNSISDETTWGHWGVASVDSDLASAFGADEYIAASTTPREVFSHNGPADGSTADIGQTDVGYKIEITPLQEAADDYTATLTYIATPTF